MKDAELVDRFRDESDIEKWMDHVRQEAKRLFSSQKGQEDHVHSNHRSPDDLDMNKHNPQPLRDVSKVLFPEDAYPSPQPISFAHRIQDGIPESTSPAFNANAELLSLESDFQVCNLSAIRGRESSFPTMCRRDCSDFKMINPWTMHI